MLRGFILAFHVLLAFMIVLLVLLQRGKGAEAGAGFGSGASGTVFGARGTSTLFSRLTAVFAALFFVTSLTLAYVGTQASAVPATLLERAAQAETTSATPATPPPSTPAPLTPVQSAPATPVQSTPATPAQSAPATPQQSPAPASRP